MTFFIPASESQIERNNKFSSAKGGIGYYRGMNNMFALCKQLLRLSKKTTNSPFVDTIQNVVTSLVSLRNLRK